MARKKTEGKESEQLRKSRRRIFSFPEEHERLDKIAKLMDRPMTRALRKILDYYETQDPENLGLKPPLRTEENET